MKYGKIFDYRNRDEAEVGKRYVFSDILSFIVQGKCDSLDCDELTGIEDGLYPFKSKDGKSWQFICEVIEEQAFMTNRQFSELMAKGYGEWKRRGMESIMTESLYTEPYADDPVGDDVMVRAWSSREWRWPTVDIYNDFCHPKCKEDA